MSTQTDPAPGAAGRDERRAGRARRVPQTAVEALAVIVILVMMLHVTVNALLRTYFDSPIPYTLEIVEYWYLPVVAFCGFVAAQSRGEHIAADLIFHRLPHVTRPYVMAGGAVLCCLCAAGFAWWGLLEALHAFEIDKTAGVSDLIAWPPYFLAPIAFGSLTVQFALAAVRAVARRKNEQAA
ncbi:TRAP transporter small permease [Actinomadura algeriensis]|uniref:TRAP-type C4-dicarboxylate transport system permease small subunit n=1 Tax=Actinomadura algeriensis TaxID=1679523 RepID=A0ABR9K2D0_9ACTN|nr:TRAP transporter small permease [Actinomadura algeriensis]MBE1536982.1 TRAP-type C4-dicarboxylate transport system permease small subunit [Actinomadura algeriensis]